MHVLATKIIDDSAFQVCMIVALVLFAIGAVMSVAERALVMALVCAGLAFFALAYVLVS